MLNKKDIVTTSNKKNFLNPNDDQAIENYIGLIFSKQQSGFKFNKDEQYKMLLDGLKSKPTKFDDLITKPNPDTDEFDQSINFTKDKKAFLKKNIMEELLHETRYKEEEIKILLELYLKYEKTGKKLKYQSFKSFIEHIYNIENHPFCERLFSYFDKEKKGMISFVDIVKSLDIIEKGYFEEKISFCFSFYDIYNHSYLDSYTLRELLKQSYAKPLITLENTITKIQDFKTKNSFGINWEEFSDPKNDFINSLSQVLPTIFDRYDYYKYLISFLELKYKFPIENLEQLWNIYKTTQKKKDTISDTKLFMAKALGYVNHPNDITENQFKLIMYDVFKIDDVPLLNAIFKAFDRNNTGCIDIKDLIGGILFFFRGKFDYKIAFYFEINMDFNGIVRKETLIKLLNECLKLYKEVFDSSKKIADAMNTSFDGKIKYGEFISFCERFPSAMDFLGRITIGNYPLVETSEAKSNSVYLPLQKNQPKYKDLIFPEDENLYEDDDDSLKQFNSHASKRWISRNNKIQQSIPNTAKNRRETRNSKIKNFAIW